MSEPFEQVPMLDPDASQALDCKREQGSMIVRQKLGQLVSVRLVNELSASQNLVYRQPCEEKLSFALGDCFSDLYDPAAGRFDHTQSASHDGWTPQHGTVVVRTADAETLARGGGSRRGPDRRSVTRRRPARGEPYGLEQ
jgi:hypothetical protein